jgi:superfamily II DNA or RNA helicase
VIADAVGLGKTIQAGLILLELAGRAEEFRAIILVPAGLREQWRQELRDRFDLASCQADAAWLRASVAERPADVNPWSLPGIYIASIDFAKRAEVLRALEDVTWDLMVLDEAHLASASSDRRAAAHAVASRSRRTVLLTATPDAGDPIAFDALCAIGTLDRTEPPVMFFRRTRADVQGGAARRSVLLWVQPTPAERRMHDVLERYTRRVWLESTARQDARAKLATIVLRKRALSSAASLAVSVQRRLALLTGTPVAAERQLLLPLADEDPLADGVDDEDLAAPGLADVRRERRWLAAVDEAARHAARAESKAARLLRWLARVSEPVIVFTEYRDTLYRLERLVRATGRPVTILHGGLEPGERHKAQALFNAGGISLLATDAAAEGLNLHHHCRIVLHYELPWRPARIEQRAGRVDRLGQSRRVHEIALVAAGTAERLVLAPLIVRAARARAAGDVTAGLLDSLTETTVSELVMGGAALPTMPANPPPAVQTPELRAEAIAEVARLETLRHWRSKSPERPLDSRASTAVRVAAVRSRKSSFNPGVVLAYIQSLSELDGRRVHSEASVVFLDAAAWALESGVRSLRRMVEEAETLGRRRGTIIHQHLANSLHRMTERIQPLRAAAREVLRVREERLRGQIPSAARQMVQAGLFERRIVSNSIRRRAVHDAQIDELNARLESLERGIPLVGSVELAAVLLVR